MNNSSQPLIVTLGELKAERVWLIQHFGDEVRSLMFIGGRSILAATNEVNAAIAELNREIAKQEGRT